VPYFAGCGDSPRLESLRVPGNIAVGGVFVPLGGSPALAEST
jgi:hypothetical protein